MVVFLALEVAVIAFCLVWLVGKLDPGSKICLNRVHRRFICMCSIASAIILYIREGTVYSLLYGVLAGYLITCSVFDIKTQSVHRFLHLIGLAGGLSLVAILDCWGRMGDCFIFCLLQLVLFRLFYGMSDCFAFCVCSVYIVASGGGLIDCLYFMAAVFCLLTVAQLFRRNFRRNWNLRVAVALLPYIACTALFFI